MTIIAEPDFMDGFDGLSGAQITRKWNAGAGTIVTPGRSGIANSQAITLTAPLRRAVTPTNAGIAQFFWKTPSALVEATIATFYNSASGGVQLALLMTTSGLLKLVNGQTLAVIALSTNPLQSLVPSTGYYFEFAGLTHISAGTADLKINGQQVAGCFGLTGKSTSNSSNAFDSVEINYGSDSVYDDYFYRNASGGYNNAADFLGDIVIGTPHPDAISGDAGHNQGVPYGSATNGFDGIDEVNAANDETDGVDLVTNGHKHYTSFQGLVAPAGATISTIHGVQINIMARKTDPGFSHAITPGCVKAGTYGTDYLGTSQSLQDTFTVKRKAWAVRPDGTGAWTLTDIATGWEWGHQRDS